MQSADRTVMDVASLKFAWSEALTNSARGRGTAGKVVYTGVGGEQNVDAAIRKAL